ncbi:hypothetical protein E2K80_14510 [Rhodophyticola sp. CCM32]|uniref:hypothetical protein n=1 Tax=Rhodophyticola sp. CCM32 TaxID=2916397 RepID=UPI00107FC587|nr:hypothetical protein [Rhodophyticola sp. CCM32]QBY01785.1 hypothetical protein E2K80_14510 [Rhodophyticola sp. CCM32]
MRSISQDELKADLWTKRALGYDEVPHKGGNMTSKTSVILYRTFLFIMMVSGSFLIRQSYDEHAKWTEYVGLGDLSGAEAYEVGFWLSAIPGFSSLIIGAFFIGVHASKVRA